LANIELITVLKEVVSTKGFTIASLTTNLLFFAPGSFGTLRGFLFPRTNLKVHPQAMNVNYFLNKILDI
jgi:hypothetical protein